MPRNTHRTTPGKPAAAVLAALLLALLALIAGAGAASGASRNVVTLGATSAPPRPACPSSPCEAVGSVTGFQTSATGAGGRPFVAPFTGKVVAWGITTSQPRASQQKFFNRFYGSPPEARVAILKRVGGSSPPRYQLMRQSPIVILNDYLGSTVVFALDNPLFVGKGNIVGLTIPTWASAFSIGLSSNNTWRASRDPGKCSKPADLKQSRPQQVEGSVRQFGCFYNTARLDYTAIEERG